MPRQLRRLFLTTTKQRRPWRTRTPSRRLLQTPVTCPHTGNLQSSNSTPPENRHPSLQERSRFSMSHRRHCPRGGIATTYKMENMFARKTPRTWEELVDQIRIRTPSLVRPVLRPRHLTLQTRVPPSLWQPRTTRTHFRQPLKQ